jgi:hypothetical protein
MKIFFWHACTESLVFERGWSVGKRPFFRSAFMVKWISPKRAGRVFSARPETETYTTVLAKHKSLFKSYIRIVTTLHGSRIFKTHFIFTVPVRVRWTFRIRNISSTKLFSRNSLLDTCANHVFRRRADARQEIPKIRGSRWKAIPSLYFEY